MWIKGKFLFMHHQNVVYTPKIESSWHNIYLNNFGSYRSDKQAPGKTLLGLMGKKTPSVAVT